MPVAISFIRGINVTGRRMIKMEVLRALFEDLGLQNPRTHLQSGNVLFQARERDLSKLAQRIEKAIEKEVGFRPSVILRTSAELRQTIAANPFPAHRNIDPGKLLIMFLSANPGPDAPRSILNVKADPEELHLVGREVFIYFPTGQGRSKLSTLAIEKVLKSPGTCRNWNTVTKMLALADVLEQSLTRSL